MKTRNPNRSEIKEESLGIQLSRDLKEKVRSASAELGISMSAMARMIIRKYFGEDKK